MYVIDIGYIYIIYRIYIYIHNDLCSHIYYVYCACIDIYHVLNRTTVDFPQFVACHSVVPRRVALMACAGGKEFCVANVVIEPDPDIQEIGSQVDRSVFRSKGLPEKSPKSIL